ncbi:MAG: phosphoglycerate kinase [Acidobacteriia bacterium]|nr:phosphoglycerate kinase [Terriglobia bacterium]
MSIKSIRDLELKGKRVFIRVDFNVPLDEKLAVTDDTRIRASLPTIQFAREHGTGIILASHLGRPKGVVNPKYSLRPVAVRLGELIQADVRFARDSVGDEVESEVRRLKGGEICLLENLRFHKEEEANDPKYGEQLARLCDVYVNDAFGTAHRAHASTVGMIPFCHEAAAGFLMERELEYLGKLVSNPEKPFVAILGGAKVSDKIEVIRNLLSRVDALLIGGAMAYTFFLAKGIEVGKSLVEPDKTGLARELLDVAAKNHVEFLLPVDHLVASRLDEAAETRTTVVEETPADWMGVDIGPKTIEKFQEQIRRARTVFWNGPMGVFEKKPFARGTMDIAHSMADCRGITVIGGGDSVSAVKLSGVADRITHISTGGGASLEFLSGIKLPGVTALESQ